MRWLCRLGWHKPWPFHPVRSDRHGKTVEPDHSVWCKRCKRLLHEGEY